MLERSPSCVRSRNFARKRPRGHASNDKQRGVNWQFKIDDARTKLKSLYPKINN